MNLNYLQTNYPNIDWQQTSSMTSENSYKYSDSEKGYICYFYIPQFVKIIYRLDNTIDYFPAEPNFNSYKITEDNLQKMYKQHSMLQNFK